MLTMRSTCVTLATERNRVKDRASHPLGMEWRWRGNICIFLNGSDMFILLHWLPFNLLSSRDLDDKS